MCTSAYVRKYGVNIYNECVNMNMRMFTHEQLRTNENGGADYSKRKRRIIPIKRLVIY